MSGLERKESFNLTGNKRRSLSGQGGLLGRMFGSGKDSSKEQLDTSAQATSDSAVPGSPATASPSASQDDIGDMKSPSRKGSEDSTLTGPNDKRRRSSGNGGVRGLLSSAKQSLSNLGGGSSSPDKSAAERNQSPMQKLGKSDPALNVPQGSLNNSAGESAPTPRSTFRVGVTEDRNKKCRRTMEDTHAYLYNFLSTPAPSLGGAALSRAPTWPSLSASKTNDSRMTDIDSEANSGSRDMVETDNGYFAIFDGHAGTFAADWCGKKVHLLLEDIIRKNPNSPIPELLDQTFTQVDQQLEKLPLKNSGTTAVVAVLRWEDRIPNSQSATGSTAIAPATAQAATQEGATENAQAAQEQIESRLRETASRQRVLYTANVGDARIVLCRNGKALRLSYDHKGGDENEGKRIAGAGGLILNNRVNGVLAVTRALGDAYMKDLVTGHPYTTETVIQPDIDEFLILACDGLWDVCSDQEACDLVRGVQDPQQGSKILVDHALARFSTDNLSCMVVRLDPSGQKAVQEASSENLIGVEGDPPTLTGGISETEAIVTGQTVNAPSPNADVPPLQRQSTSQALAEEIKKNNSASPAIELNPAAVQAARHDATA